MMSSPSTSKPRRRRAEDPLPGAPVGAEPGGGLLDRAQHHAGAAVVERMGEVDLGPAPLEAVVAPARGPARTASRPPSGARPSSGRGSGPGRVSSLRARAAADRRPRPRAPSPRRPSRASATAQASPFGPEPTTIASLTPGCRRLSPRPGAAGRPRTGKLPRLVQPGQALDHVGDLDPALLDQPRRRVVDPVVLASAMLRRLGLERDDPQLARLESAALLDRLEQLLVVEVAVAEVPAVDDAGDQLALADVVGLDVVDRARQQARSAPGRGSASTGTRGPCRAGARPARGRRRLTSCSTTIGAGFVIDAVELLLGAGVLAEEPLARRPVAGVVAHRRQERDLVRAEVAEDRHGDADQRSSIAISSGLSRVENGTSP